MAFRIAVDIGGTFTDLVVFNEETGELSNTKALTTLQALTDAVLICIDQAGVDLPSTRLVIHGTTVGINALIERKGAKTGLITTEGFRDVLEIGRGNFQRMYDLLYERPPMLVPRRLRLEVPERMDSSGNILTPLDESAVRAASVKMRAEKVESVAIVFLFSYLNATHEKRAAEIVKLEMPEVSVTVSHGISQEWREYERTSTAVVNAFIQPIIERYLREFIRSLRKRSFDGRLLITQSNGGVFSVDAALAKPVHTLESGPAAGAVGCAAIGHELGHDKLISFDMGGTTAKCAIIEKGFAQIAEEYSIEGHPIRIPVIDIKEVSAGGGSIAWIDAGGALAVGPRSAGAHPGPACYGLGGAEPTITDANLAIGRMNPEAFLGGRMALDANAAAASIDRNIAAPLSMDRVQAATGIIRLADVKMALAVRSITTERGLDPRGYTLVAYGGCGPLHAAAVARELSIPTVWIPPAPATFSAWGMLAADLRHDLVRTVLAPISRTSSGWAANLYEEMREEILRVFPSSGPPILKRAADLRYLGQVHTVTVGLDTLAEWNGLRARFDAAHLQAYGYSAPDVEVELLNLRLTAITPVERPRLRKIGSSSDDTRVDKAIGKRLIYSTELNRMELTAVYDRVSLKAGDTIEGPAAIEEPSTTTILDMGDRLRVSELGFLIIEVARA